MFTRNKVIAIESMIVMFVLILFAFVVFLVIDAGTNAYNNITNDKVSTESARVAYSYINMKIKQHDASDGVNVIQTEFGDTLKIDFEDSEFSSFIFFFEGALYECLSKSDIMPKVDASNMITKLMGISIEKDGSYIHIECVTQNGEQSEITRGTVGLRS